MWDIFPTYLNQAWNCTTLQSGKCQIVAGAIRENEPISYDKVIAVLEDSPIVEERAKLIANAPNMFRLLCNIAGEVEYGTARLPDFLMDGIDDVIRDIARH
ncbi:MAG: hypothetical protein IJG36_07050 [Synergistaceae bacterium]|nr:hypothetical protein [Synergistaceae bacterium]